MENTFNVKFKEPKFILVVGNYKNAKKEEIDEASRAINKILIVDYDTLVSYILGFNDKVTSASP
jgi:hypothetical protein